MTKPVVQSDTKGALGECRGAPNNNIAGYETALWRCGRCFDSKPVMRVFDCLGRVEIFMLEAALAPTA